MANPSKKTLLHGRHTALGATMADFGGYEMPLWYASAKNEHLAVLTRAGIFDTSHMATVLADGPGARDLLQRCFTNDLDRCIGKDGKPLFPGRCVYGAFLDEGGHVIDDAIVFQIANDRYMVVVNAGMGPTIAGHIEAHRDGADVRITDLTDNLGKMDIQGPLSAKILRTILASPETVFDKMPYFSFKGHFDPAGPGADAVRLTDGTPILLSRTGYTGEFGFEIFVAPEHFPPLWDAVLSAGEASGLIPCGLAARDSLRAGAVLPLSHQDIGGWPFIRNPWPFALPYTPDQTGFTKSFIGDQALRDAGDAPYTFPFAGSDLRKVSLPATVQDAEGREIGTVLTCATDMGIGRCDGRIYSVASPDRPETCKIKGLCCGFVKVEGPLSPGGEVELADARRRIRVRIEADVRPDRTARKPLKEMV